MALSGLMSKVNFANKVPLLMRATSSDPSPPAGHVFEEISRITYESLDQCDVLVEFLTERLKKNSPQIKLKVLLIMKFVVQKGQKEFQHSLSKQAQGIRQARSFNGPPDPLHGDAPYVKVREAAGQLLEILFDTEREKNSENHQAHGYSSQTTMQGFGSSRSNSGDVLSSSSNKMEGFGSVSSQKNQEPGIISDVFNRVKDNISYAFNENASAIAKYANRETDSAPDSYQRYQNAESKIVRTPSSTFNFSGSTSHSSTEDFHSSYEPTNFNEVKWEEKAISKSEHLNKEEENDQQDLVNDPHEAVKDWSQEVRLVNDVTIPGGIKLNPSRSELEHFIKRCGSLDFAKIVELVGEKLCCPDYKVQMKSLFVVESILTSSIPDACEIISSNLLADIEKLANSSQTAVKNKATKLLHLLKPKQSHVGKNQPAEKNTHTSTGQLLSIGTVEKQQDNKKSDSGYGTNSATASNDDLSSIFGGLNLKNEQSQPNAMSSMELTGDLSLLHSDDSVTNSNSNTGKNDFLLGISQPGPECDMVSSRLQTTPVSSQNSLGNLFDLDPFNMDKAESKGYVTDQRTARSTAVNSAEESSSSMISEFDFLDPFSNKILASSGSSQQQYTKEISINEPVNHAPIRTSNNTPTATQVTMPSNNQIKSSYSNIPKERFSGPQNNNMNFLYQNPIQNQQYFNQANSFNQVRPAESRSLTSNSAQKGFNQERKTLANIPSNTNSQSSNGFQFLSSRKPGAFDFVKDAMEASKRK